MFLLLASAIRGFLGGLCRRWRASGIRWNRDDTHVPLGRKHLDPVLHFTPQFARLSRQNLAANLLLYAHDRLIQAQAALLRRLSGRRAGQQQQNRRYCPC